MPTYILEQTAYSFFGVSPTASPFEIQEAYRRMARKFPADRVWDTPMASVAKMGLQEVERWYANIGSPGARAEYDAMLAAKQRPVEVRQSSDHAVMLDDVVKDCVLKNNSADDDVGQIHAILTKEVERNDDNYHDDNNTKPVLNKDKITKTDFESEEYADSTNEETQCGQGKDEIKDVDSDGSVSSEAAALDAPSYGKDASHSPSATAAGMVMLDQATVLYPNASARKVKRTLSRCCSAFGLILLFFILTFSIPHLLAAKHPSPYHLLGLPEDYTLDKAAIRSAYHREIRVHHPDKHPLSNGKSPAMVAISEAYEVLTDPHLRCVYETKQQLGWHPLGTMQWRMCDHLQPVTESEEITAEDGTNDSYDAVMSFQPFQMAVINSLRGLLQSLWRRAGEAAGRLLSWLKSR